ncbi:hypothetical protein [Methyloceanibacter marginalis]|uniref:hypothetical protein n=1 Tax=Methyloceanibacter marginalis TaxID=1774971 RepID=UPI00114C9C33|nr:hypothetical protein [Methyloceanibacter marginalis]
MRLRLGLGGEIQAAYKNSTGTAIGQSASLPQSSFLREKKSAHPQKSANPRTREQVFSRVLYVDTEKRLESNHPMAMKSRQKFCRAPDNCTSLHATHYAPVPWPSKTEIGTRRDGVTSAGGASTSIELDDAIQLATSNFANPSQ